MLLLLLEVGLELGLACWRCGASRERDLLSRSRRLDNNVARRRLRVRVLPGRARGLELLTTDWRCRAAVADGLRTEVLVLLKRG